MKNNSLTGRMTRSEWMDIYGMHRPMMEEIMERMVQAIESDCRDRAGSKLFEHISCRIKSDASTREKLSRLGVPDDEQNALNSITDSIGIRIVCLFIDDVYECDIKTVGRKR